MSGTFQLDSELFPKDPLTKRWTRQPIAAGGTGETIYSEFWRCEMSFGILEVPTEVSFFEGKWFADTLHTVVLPHPKTGSLTGFTGVNIQDFSYEFNDIESNNWAATARLSLTHINLSATGTV